MDWLLGRLTRFTEHVSGKIRVRSALNPLLWLSAIAVPSGLILLLESSANPVNKAAGLFLIVIPVLACGCAYFYFMVNAPEKLRSEDFELRRLALSLIEEKGGAIAIAETSVEAISNPQYSNQKLLQDE